MAKRKNLNSAPATPYTRKERYLSVIAGVSDLDTLPTNPENREERYLDAIANKPSGKTYTAGNGISISDGDVISADTTVVQEKLTAGTGITISGNTISTSGGGGKTLYAHNIWFDIYRSYGGGAVIASGRGFMTIINDTATQFYSYTELYNYMQNFTYSCTGFWTINDTNSRYIVVAITKADYQDYFNYHSINIDDATKTTISQTTLTMSALSDTVVQL